jgi:hypothetical protein
MTDVDKLNKRRAHIKELLDTGGNVDAKEIAKMFSSSYAAVLNDISVVMTGTQAYRKPLTTTENTRARKLGIPGILTEADWNKVLKEHNNACAKCGSTENLTIDHKYPVSKKGTNTPDNIQPLCKSCNSRKGNRT